MTQNVAVPPSSSGELAYMDACRAFFVLLGIALHAAMPFAPASGPWIVNAEFGSDALDYLTTFIGSFRMPGFFIIAGYFAAPALADRDPVAWLRKRGTRLGIPLAVGVLFIVPLESLAVALSRFSPDGGWSLVARDAFARHSTLGFHLVSHLWFILDLLVMSLTLAVVAYCIGGHRLAKAFSFVARQVAKRPVVLGSLGLLGLSAHLVFLERLTRSWLSGYLYLGGAWPMWGILDAVRIAFYVPFFVIGMVLFHNRELLARFTTPSKALVLLALAFLLAKMLLPAGAAPWILPALSAPAAVFLTSMWMQLGKLVTPYMSGAIRWLSGGSYTIYIVHQPIVVLAAVGALGLGLTPEIGFFAVLAIAASVSVGTFWLLQNNRWAALLLNGRRLPQRVAGRGSEDAHKVPAYAPPA